MGISPHGKILVNTSKTTNKAHFIDTETLKTVQKIAFKIAGMPPEPIQPVGINITRDGKTGFVALEPSNHVAVVDEVTYQVTKYLLVGQRVWHMAFTPDEKYLLTTNGVSNDVSIIDVPAPKVINIIQVAQQPWGITMSDR